jgi:hypothetical protein
LIARQYRNGLRARHLPIGWSNYPPVRPPGRLEAARSPGINRFDNARAIGPHEIHGDKLLHVGSFQSPNGRLNDRAHPGL